MISAQEQEVWIKYIDHIHGWRYSTATRKVELSFAKKFMNGSPVYRYHVYDEKCFCLDEECECINIWYNLEVEDKTWLMTDCSGSGWFWDIHNPETDRYPPLSKDMREVVDFRFQDQFKYAFDKIDKMLSFKNGNVIFKILAYIRRINDNFPVEMVMHILSFLRVCEILL